jgi:serine protease Do
MRNSPVKFCLALLVFCFLNGQVSAQSLPDFTVLVEENAPAIVNVSSRRNQPEIDDQQRANIEELLRYFYRQEIPDGLELPDQDRPSPAATGSGFIIDPTGYIVTNHHVVADADEITITLNDQREYAAEVVGSDELSDLALLKIEANGLPSVKFGDSSKLKVGEWVLAIGSPFGLQYSVSAGIISYMGRSLPTGGANYVSFIQTDVAINPGNSGGPLFNLRGEVVGINSQIFTNSGGSIGLSFAIPVDVARNVVGQLRETGKVTRGWLGVGYEDVSQELAEAFDLDTPHGALINQVIEGSPAHQAGIRSGDIVVAFNDQVIRTSADLPYYVGLLMPGSQAKLDIIRNGNAMQMDMTIGARETPATLGSVEEAESGNRLGLQVAPLDRDTRSALGIEGGVVVENVEGVAAEARLRPGDVIVTLNNEVVSSQEELDALAATLPADRALPILIARDGRQTFFTLRIPE